MYVCDNIAINSCNILFMKFIQNENRTLREHHNKIIECYWDSRNGTWKFMRIREDKSFPNSHVTAKSK